MGREVTHDPPDGVDAVEGRGAGCSACRGNLSARESREGFTGEAMLVLRAGQDALTVRAESTVRGQRTQITVAERHVARRRNRSM